MIFFSGLTPGLTIYYRSTLVIMNTATMETSTDIATLMKQNSVPSSHKEIDFLKVKTGFVCVCFRRGLPPTVV